MSQSPELPNNLKLSLEIAQSPLPSNNTKWIIPVPILESIVNEHTVTEELKRVSASSPISEDELEYYVSQICQSRKKIFAVLLCGWGEEGMFCNIIKDLVDQGINDSDLPFERHPVERITSHQQNGRLYSLRKKGHGTCQKSECSCTIGAFRNWLHKDIKNLLNDQWMVLSPVFRKKDKQIPPYELDHRAPMPFEEDHERTPLRSEGGYSEVWPVRFYAGHQNLYTSLNGQDKEPMLAIKRLKSSEKRDFDYETEMLTAYTIHRHKHLVALLATYKYNEKYHLLFPYADANLRSFWEEFRNEHHHIATQEWALDQMTGLASGLDEIHTYQSNMAFDNEQGNPGLSRFRDSAGRSIVIEESEAKFGRHGDIKPENILWFKGTSSKGISGMLQITDFGLGRFHSLDSRSIQDPRGIKGSATYIPPEIPRGQAVSRAYDIWSIGCLFLEFATWLVDGFDGLRVFGERRKEKAFDTILDDTFYTAIAPDGVVTNAVLRPSVSEWIKDLHRSPNCTQMVHDLLDLLQDKLLVVEPKSRITAANLYLEFKKMIEKSKKEPGDYL